MQTEKVQNVRREIINVAMDAEPETLERMLAALKARPKVGRIGSAREAAAILGCCVRSVHRLAAAGRLRAIRRSARTVRFDMSEVERFATEGVVL